jgi:hypothetical protein
MLNDFSLVDCKVRLSSILNTVWLWLSHSHLTLVATRFISLWDKHLSIERLFLCLIVIFNGRTRKRIRCLPHKLLYFFSRQQAACFLTCNCDFISGFAIRFHYIMCLVRCLFSLNGVVFLENIEQIYVLIEHNIFQPGKNTCLYISTNMIWCLKWFMLSYSQDEYASVFKTEVSAPCIV